MDKNTSKAYVETTGPIAGALAPTGEVGTPLFLINLCASMAPVQLNSKSLPGLESYRLYQVTRVEDGRTRYRLRLGFFESESEAEEVLVKVREQYPTAFTACLCEEDRRHTRGYVVPPRTAKPTMTVVPSPTTPAVAAPPLARSTPAAPPTQAKSPPSAAVKPSPAANAAPVSRQPAVPAAKSTIEIPRAHETSATAKTKAPSIGELTGLDDLSWEPTDATSKQPALKSASAPQKNSAPAAPKAAAAVKPEPKRTAPSTTIEPKHDTAASMRVKALDLTLSDPPPPPTQKASAPSSQPFHVGKGIDIPTTQLSLQSESAASVAAKAPATKAPPSAPAASGARSTPTAPAKAPVAKAPPMTPAKPAMPVDAKHPDLDSTQTIRALTAEELNDESQEKVFAIQLAASEQPVNLDAMPHLDIFEAYRLYSVATAGSGKIVHSLRLGFFKEAVSAEAVAGYLKTFFSTPTVIRISVAEQARFKDATLPKKPEPETKATVVELNTVRSARVPTVTMEVVPGPDTSATGSFKMNATGSFRTSETATHRTLPAKPAAKSAPTPTKRSAPIAKKKTSTSGKYKMPSKKSLAEQLLDEAKEVELSESGIFKMQKNESSLLSRLVDKLKK